jgi:prepilin-type N-terminal cleavage/methylation domain-containing protein
MNQCSRGFSLIEVIVALFLSSIIMFSAYHLFMKTQTSVSLVRSVIDKDFSLPIFYNQFEKNITGALAQPVIEKSKKKTGIDDFISSVGQALEKKGRRIQKGQKAPDFEPLNVKDIFVSTGSDKDRFMSFISTSGIDSFKTTEKSKKNPLLKRIMYKLEQDPFNDTGFLRILYKETTDLTQTAMKKDDPEAYEILSGIESWKITYYVFEYSKEKKEPQLVTLSSWDKEAIMKKYHTSIPAYIDFDINFKDPEGQYEKTVKMKFKLYAYVMPRVSRDEQKEDSATEIKKDAEKKEDKSS